MVMVTRTCRRLLCCHRCQPLPPTCHAERVHNFRVGATDSGAPSRWRALALSFFSCALFWICAALDFRGVIPALAPPTTWQCILLSELRVPLSHAAALVLYNLVLAFHCFVWLSLTNRGPNERVARALQATVSVDFTPLATRMFNAKQAYLWLLLIVAGALRFPDKIVHVVLFVETLHTFKAVVLNKRSLSSEPVGGCGWQKDLSSAHLLSPHLATQSHSTSSTLPYAFSSSVRARWLSILASSLLPVFGPLLHPAYRP